MFVFVPTPFSVLVYSIILMTNLVWLLGNYLWLHLWKLHLVMVSAYARNLHVVMTVAVTGLYLNMFYGDAVTHIVHYQLKLYFICKEGVTMDGPKLEHIKDDYDAHIKILTKYAC